MVTGKNYAGLPTLFEPFQLKTEQRAADKKRPADDLLVEIDVTVPPNYVTKLHIFKGDSIVEVVRDFSLKWDLRAITTQNLQNQIIAHLN